MDDPPRFIRSQDPYGRLRWLSVDMIGSANVGSLGDWFLTDFSGRKLGTAKPEDFDPSLYRD
jgi:hypothetical protein